MYCEKCKTVFEVCDKKGRCPDCNSKKVREVKSDDVCFLTERPLVLSGLLEEVLKQNGIPCLTKGRLGAALTMTIGSFIETVCFYVPYTCLEKSKELVEEIFASSDEFDEDYDDYEDDDDFSEDKGENE